MIYMNSGENVSDMEMWINRKKSDVGKDGCDKKMNNNEIKRKEK